MLFWRMIDLNKVSPPSPSSVPSRHPSRGNPYLDLRSRGPIYNLSLDLQSRTITDISASEHTYTIQEKQ
jgi:hypothetical protein